MTTEKTVVNDSALFSDCGNYRYLLTREFGGDSTCVFVMLNPSTADANHDDPTIRRCVSFAKREGFGRLEIVNLFGFRATEPSDLFAAADPIGEENDAVMAATLSRADQIVVAWGNHGEFVDGRIAVVQKLLAQSGASVFCFGLTGKSQPKHPLYLSNDVELVAFSHTA